MEGGHCFIILMWTSSRTNKKIKNIFDSTQILENAPHVSKIMRISKNLRSIFLTKILNQCVESVARMF